MNTPKDDKNEKLTSAVPEQTNANAEIQADTASAEVAEPIEKKPHTNPFKNKHFKYGSMSVLLSVIFVVAIVLINVIATVLTEKFNVKADLTDASIYSIEDSTAEYIKSISEKVTITVTSTESDFTGGGAYYVQTNEILKKIANLNENITLNYLDILSNPSFSAKFTETLTAAQIILQCETTNRYKIVSYNEYLTITYNQTALQYGMQQIDSVEGNCEASVTSALMSVTNADPTKVAVLTSYGESANAVMTNLLQTNGYEVENVDISLKESLSDDYDFVFIFGPTSDYKNEDITKIETWLDNGGKFGKNLLYFASTSLGKSPNLDAFLAEWGLIVGSGTLYQTSTDYAYESAPEYMILNVPETNFSEFGNSNVVYGVNIRPVSAKWEGYSNMETTVLLNAYDGAVIKPADAESSWKPSANDEKGAYGCAVASTKTRFEGTDPISSRIFAFGSMEMLSSSFLTANQANNAKLMMNIFNVTSGKEDGIYIAPKSFDMTTFEITATQKNVMVAIFIVIIPIVIIILGIVIWARRKHR